MHVRGRDARRQQRKDFTMYDNHDDAEMRAAIEAVYEAARESAAASRKAIAALAALTKARRARQRRER